jgi:Histidine kinase-, DNA gyrase B-, and HSP90-like ATPase
MPQLEEVRDSVPISGVVRLIPDPRSLEALGRNHTLEAALGELVDNSIDAGARNVLIRFVRAEGRLMRLLVVDDGAGIDSEHIDVAMTVGGNRRYAGTEIGRFGLGLKAASFSQARSVTVVSKARGSDPAGRRWQMTHAKRDFQCEIVAPGFAVDQLSLDWGFPIAQRGTLVRWDDVKGFPAVDDAMTIDRFLQATIAKIRTHLGLIFHRILDAADVRIHIDVEDEGEVTLNSEVLPLDPFGYPRTGAAGWPKQLEAEGEGETLSLECHIWPGRSTAEQFRLDGDLIQRQGLYVYYNRRLVQCGGWNGLCHADKQLNLARISLNIDGDVDRMVSLKPEKNGVEIGPGFGPAIAAAKTTDGTTFSDYIDQARGTLKEANRRRRIRSAIVPPGTGIPAKVRRAFSRELTFKNEDPVEIRWAHLQGDDFFEIDREQSVLWLNSRYRKALAGGRSGSLNDLPVVKTLMFLLVENIYAGRNMGPRDKDNIEMWQAILTTAAQAEFG